MLNFIKYYKVWYGISALIIAACIACVVAFNLKLGIDFTGGAITHLRFEQQVPPNDEIRRVFAENNIQVVTIQPSDDQTVIVRMPAIEKDEYNQALAALNENFGPVADNDRFSLIGPVIGRELRSQAVVQLILVTLGIILYIAYAFRKVSKPVSSWKFGVAAIIALLHDLLVVLGVFALLGHFMGVEIDSLFVTAILTVLGFSVHDTIVVFDRIRENLRMRSGQNLPEVLNNSINQTLIRSINTTATVVFVLLSLLLFGGESIRWFVTALLVGVVAGTYSSVFIASPILLTWHKWDLKRKS